MKFIAHYSSSLANLYEIQTVEGRLLIECGALMKKIKEALNYDLSNIHGCLVSHGHKDHCASMDKLMGEGINVYSTLTTDGRRHHEIDKYMTIGPFRIYAFPLCHDVQCTGFIVMHDGESLLFITDTGKIPQRFEMLFDIVAIEANYYDDVLDYQVQTGRYPEFIAKRIRKYHMRIDQTKEYLKDCCDLSRCREIHLLHMSEVVEKEDVIKDFSKQFIGIKVA